MQNALLLATKLQKLGKVDRRFFLICGIIIAVIIAVYFLIPVFRREQYEMQRNNLREREKAFNAAKQARDAEAENNTTVDLSTQANDQVDDKQRMKKGSIFAKIIYYLFVFSFGIILAIFLPFIFMYDGEALNIIQDQLDSKQYVDAMAMVGGYYNKTIVLNECFEAGGGIVLFEAATLYEYEYKADEENAEACAELKNDYDYTTDLGKDVF